MKTLYPEKLQPGDEIRIVSLSQSLSAVDLTSQRIALQRLQSFGFTVTFARNACVSDMFESSSIKDRLADFTAAMQDPKVKIILASTGGYNVNQLLELIDYQMIRQHPKIISGYSDITALLNAIYARSGVATYSGPCFSTFGMQKGFAYTQEYWLRCLTQNTPYVVQSSKRWSNDAWDKNQAKRTFLPNRGLLVIQEGKAIGVALGGSLCTVNLLQGTLYMPALKNSILFIEDDNIVGEFFAPEFERNLISLLQQADAKFIRGIVFGRFEKSAKMTIKKLRAIVGHAHVNPRIPIIANADFGHTTPQCTFPVGGEVRVVAKGYRATIEILKH